MFLQMITKVCEAYFSGTIPSFHQLQLIKQQQRPMNLKIIKEAPQDLAKIEIQNMLAQNYHFLKWQLVEVMEVEKREMQFQMAELQATWLLRDLEDTVKQFIIGITNTSQQILQKQIEVNKVKDFIDPPVIDKEERPFEHAKAKNTPGKA